ncbi:CNNM domain-containing protein [Motiliproteus sp. SC1-56]|uniref:CNNM domain-containing protein n=1 Tax=Motiliproteus sp. SC1-56 TaxID=2799565 RepID=UPI001A8D8530|nr:CNNM domain-containing protein [Motiliproteus sp. SC1-56]
MTLLIIYILIALGFSFLCSVAEAVLLSVTPAHVALLEEEGRPSGPLLARLKADINRPLAAILTLNTIAHTIGAAGAGAQGAAVFGNAYVGVISAVLTLLILIFSEIIPKTLGAVYWRQLAPATAHTLRVLIALLLPFVKLSEWLTRGIATEHTLNGFSREEFAAMARLSAHEGELGLQESAMLQNLLLMHRTQVRDAMTPRPVVFSLPSRLKVEGFFLEQGNMPFSRIPLYGEQKDQIVGFVLKSDLLLAQARGERDNHLSQYKRELHALPETLSLAQAFEEFMRKRAHIMLVVDEYGAMEGILTLEDLLETLLGLEIVDEQDRTTDMQRLARMLWKRRAKAMGIDIRTSSGPGA